MWNYRVIRRKFSDDYSEYSEFNIYEVYYDENGKVNAWINRPMEPYGNSLSDLKEDIGMFMKALELPVLAWEDMPEVDRP